MKLFLAILLLVLAPVLALAEDSQTDNSRDILVTFASDGIRTNAGAGAPYRFRKRYVMSAMARRHAKEIAREYDLVSVDDWPISSLSVYCVVFRLADEQPRDSVIARLQADERVESAQPLNQFETGNSTGAIYDDTYAGLQHGLDELDVLAAHAYSTGSGVRIAVIDSHADLDHEDLSGRVATVKFHVNKNTTPDQSHGTAVVSVIAAIANNSKGIVGVAPAATVELHVACWRDSNFRMAICDSLSLAKALDALAGEPPDILNLSLTGPKDPLLQRLIEKVYESGTIVVAAAPATPDRSNGFPANLEQVISVTSSEQASDADLQTITTAKNNDAVFAPGRRIMVAIPGGGYDFRSGTSIAAAHVSGVIALLLSDSPDLDDAAVQSLLRRSQTIVPAQGISVDACRALQLMVGSRSCSASSNQLAASEPKPDT